MMKFLISAPALFADLANGIFAVHIAAFLTGTEIMWWHYLIGILLAMLPDLDALPELFQRGKLAASASHIHDHRELLHVPLVFLGIGVLAAYLYGYWGSVFLLATMLHFVNDLYGTGWGVPVLKPMSKDRFKLFSNVDNNMSLHLNDWIRRIPINDLTKQIVDHGNENWIEDTYWKLTPISVIEYALFGISIVLVVVTLL